MTHFFTGWMPLSLQPHLQRASCKASMLTFIKVCLLRIKGSLLLPMAPLKAQLSTFRTASQHCMLSLRQGKSMQEFSGVAWRAQLNLIKTFSWVSCMLESLQLHHHSVKIYDLYRIDRHSCSKALKGGVSSHEVLCLPPADIVQPERTTSCPQWSQ